MVSMVSGLRTRLKIWELQFRGTFSKHWRNFPLSSRMTFMFSWLYLSLFSHKCKCCYYYLRYHNRKKRTPQNFLFRSDEVKFRIQWIKLYAVESGNGACNDAICTFILKLLAYMFLLIWMEHLTGIMSNKVISCIIDSINHTSITGMRIKMDLVMLLIYTPC